MTIATVKDVTELHGDGDLDVLVNIMEASDVRGTVTDDQVGTAIDTLDYPGKGEAATRSMKMFFLFFFFTDLGFIIVGMGRPQESMRMHELIRRPHT